jgi:hypothetical protein
MPRPSLRRPTRPAAGRTARVVVPTPDRAPRIARVAAVATLLLGGYTLLWAISFADVIRRILETLLKTLPLPAWALGGGIAAIVCTIATGLLARVLLTDARRLADQDPRHRPWAVPAIAVATALHTVLVGGPFSPWLGASPPAAYPFSIALTGSGVPALLAAPVVVAVAIIALLARTRAEGWLRQLPD